MTDKVGVEQNIVCRQARKRFAALDERATSSTNMSVPERAATNRHVQTCSRCAIEYRLFLLQRAAFDAAAAAEPITPDEDFFRALRARIARGPELSPSRRADESWAAALLVTARQLVPAMALLLLLMVGATLLWNQPPPETSQVSQAAVRPRERVVFPDMYDYPEPTRDDVLETLVAVEEKENGK
jgi:hypothetical protein